jgi:hypothetical protein
MPGYIIYDIIEILDLIWDSWWCLNYAYFRVKYIEYLSDSPLEEYPRSGGGGFLSLALRF